MNDDLMTPDEFRESFKKDYPDQAWTVGLEEHPENHDGPCACDECIDAFR
jgi:hypothetical protein